MNPHISAHPIGTEVRLTWKRRKGVTAKLHRREFHSEEWRVLVNGGYVFSEGWRWVSEHLATDPPATLACECCGEPAGEGGALYPACQETR